MNISAYMYIFTVMIECVFSLSLSEDKGLDSYDP